MNPTQIEIVQRPKQAGDMDALLTEMSANGYIGEFNRADLLAQLDADACRWVYYEGSLAGFVGWRDFGERWIEIGPIYTMERHRALRLGNLLAETFISVCGTPGTHLWGLSKNPIVFKMFETYGFKQTSYGELAPQVRWGIIRRVLRPSRLLSIVRKLSRDPVRYYMLSK